MKTSILAAAFLLSLGVWEGCTSGTAMEKKVLKTDYTTTLRAPAYPLINSDPYFGFWSMTEKLYDGETRHWTGKEFPMTGVLRVDGKLYRFMGKEHFPMKPILPSSNEEQWQGKYTFRAPLGGGWLQADWDDRAWKDGTAAWGTSNEPNLGAPWETEDIWVRRVFRLDEDLTGRDIYLHYSHDDIFELYINGKKVVDTGYSWKYNILEKLPEEIVASLRQGDNVISAHCHNRTGGGYVDFGLFEKQQDNEIFPQTAQQKSVTVLPTQTYYTFACGPVDLDLIFTSPLLPDDLDLISRPVGYITYQTRANDGQQHDVEIYFDTTPQWVVHTDSQPVTVERVEQGSFTYLKTGTVEQPILKRKGDDVRIDWGYFYLAGHTGEDVTMGYGDYQLPKKQFAEKGVLDITNTETKQYKMTKYMPVLAYSHKDRYGRRRCHGRCTPHRL